MSDNQHRLFPLHQFVQVLNEQELNDLMSHIKNDYLNKTDNNPGTNSIEAGQTYIGQMIAHDIVSSTNLEEKRMNISPTLNLDSLYGDDYNPAYFDQYGYFVFGSSIEKIDKNREVLIYGNDLLRDINGKALIPDSRNDENLIISQLHLFWQKFHNKVLRELISINLYKNPFVIAKNIVIQIFHEVVINDFLNQILKHEIYNLYFKNSSKFTFKYGKNKSKFTKIPLEFSKAAFRFGHSMIRNEYELNNSEGNRKLSIKKILLNRNQQINTKDVIEWDNFFTTRRIFDSLFHLRNNKMETKKFSILPTKRQGLTASAFRIDTKIICTMANLPFKVKLQKNDSKADPTFENDIRCINLQANLDTSQIIYNGETIRLQLEKFNEFNNLLNNKIYENPILKKLPLWPYILKEAELNFDGNDYDGLGCIGSVLIAEVIKASIKSFKINKSKKYKKAHSHIRNLIKESQIKSEKELGFWSDHKIRYEINNSPIKMGFCINYNK